MNPVTTPKNTRADVVAELRELRRECGKPTYQQICDISERLGELYGAEHGFRYLSISTVCEILNGTRKPRWETVRSYVLACNRYRAQSSCGAVPDPGVSALGYWFGLLSASTAPSSESEVCTDIAPVQPEPEPEPQSEAGSAPHPDQELVLRVLLNRGLFRLDPYDLRENEPVELDVLLQRLRLRTTDPLLVVARRYQDWFRHRYVIDLLDAAYTRADPEAAGRLAILLTCAGHADEAHRWLEQAATAGEVIAMTLLHTEPPYRRGLAVDIAYELAVVEGNLPWEIVPDPDTPAEVYGRVAARCGHAGATYWLAARHAARRDFDGAAYWYTAAAAQGDLRAEGAFERIHQSIWARINPDVITLQAITDEWESEPPMELPSDHPG